MAPRRKTRGWLTASERPDHQCHHHHHHHKHQKIEPRAKMQGAAVAGRKKAEEYAKAIDEPNAVEEWVYRFLGNLAAIESDKKEAKKRVTHLRFRNIRQARGKKKPFRRFRSPTPYSWDRVTPRSPVSALREPAGSQMSLDDREEMDELDYEEDGEDTTSTGISPRLPDVRPSPPPGSVPLRDPPLPAASGGGKIDSGTLLQKINGYIRAGIAEGKRRAKHYVRKALSFALETGYLIPADREGKLLRVSPTLISSSSNSQHQQQQQAVQEAASQRRRRTTRRVGSRRRARTMKSGRAGRARNRRANRKAAPGRHRVTDDKKLEGKVKAGKRKQTGDEQGAKTGQPENQKEDGRDNVADKPQARSRDAPGRSSSSVAKAPTRANSSKDEDESDAPIALPAGTVGTRAASADVDRKPKIQPSEQGRSRSASASRSSRKSREKQQQKQR